MVLPWIPLDPVLANIFVCDFEEKCLMNSKISPSFWNRYVVMFHDKDGANEFLHCLNSCHSNFKFTIEFEQARENEVRLWSLGTGQCNSVFGHSCYK